MRNMNKKKWIIIGVVILALITSLAIAIPVFAAESNATPSPTQLTPANKAGALLRLLLVQDQTKAFAYVQQAEDAGKITADQATAVENFWTEYHAQFTKAVVLRRLLRAKNEGNVKAVLDKAVANGKITQTQEDKVIKLWETLHPLASATNPLATTTP
jgi:flagellar basal body-associated protein FliL